jgi:hypothetical protein
MFPSDEAPSKFLVSILGGKLCWDECGAPQYVTSRSHIHLEYVVELVYVIQLLWCEFVQISH